MTAPAKRRPGQPAGLTAEAATAAIWRHSGILAHAAAELGVTAPALRAMARREPSVAAAIAEARGLLVERAEGVISEALAARDLTASIFVLKTLGKHRGWSQRLEVEAAPREPAEAAPPPLPAWFLPPGGRTWIAALPEPLRAKLQAELAAASVEARAGRLDIFDDHELRLLFDTRFLAGLDPRDLDRILEFQPGQYRAEIEAARLPGEGPHPGGVPLDLSRISPRAFSSLIGGVSNLYSHRTGRQMLPHPLEPFDGIPPPPALTVVQGA